MKKKRSEARTLSASLTVEASLVVSIVLITTASMLLMGFKLHDRMAAKNAVYRAMEEYSYRNPDTDTIEMIREECGSDNLYILYGHPTVELEPGYTKYGISGEIADNNNRTGYRCIHLRTETILRASTLSDLAKSDKEEKKTNDNQERAKNKE